MTMHWTHLLFTFALQHLWHSALLFLIAVVVVTPRLFSAEARSWLLAGTLVLAAASPLMVLLPGTAIAPTSTVTAPSESVQSVARSTGVPTNSSVAPSSERPAVPVDMLQLLAALWLTGTLFVLARLLVGMQQARRLHRTGQADATLRALLGPACPARADVAVSEHVHGPMVVGLLRPRILVPRTLLDALPAEALRHLLLHEAAHIERRDLWASAAQRAVLALFWWSPFMHLIGRRLDAARESACDARAAVQAGSGRRYAESLLNGVSALIQQREHHNALAVGMSVNRSGLTERIDQLLALEPGHVRRGMRWSALGLCVLALGIHASVALAVTPRLGTSVAHVPRPAVRPAESPDARDLVDAAADGDVARMRRLVDEGVPVNASVFGDGTALISAARNGQLAALDALLEMGAQPDLAAAGEGNPLIVAAAPGHLAVVERLVAAGADVNRHVMFDETPLINAARSGDLATVAFLIEHGADVNLGVMADGRRWRSPYNQSRNAVVRDYLVQHGAVAARR
ncbi:M56 family metallopeptidase [Stenotrophomonas sp. PS02289]|uniref:M56 family metallopeptidase n=1 Tax=Stenotrophomonas sp. PS02289 TaxID=2991422 RepID=UPI00249AC32A|nr:M56 family metallopeptidase [Stenotrophomonas sp. PS02289]